MTEADWLACDNPKAMLAFAAERLKASDRKFRLFACACCRRVWHHFTDDRSRQAVCVAEEFADGIADEETREQVLESASAVRRLPSGLAAKWTLVASAKSGAMMVVDTAGQTAASGPDGEYAPELWHAESIAQTGLIRESFGNPFRSSSFNPLWLAWNDDTIAKLAQSIYTDRAFDRLPILADALEDAGCDDADLLAHCRGGGEHVRGCWVLDMILGKE